MEQAMTTLTPEQRQLSAEFEASLRGGRLNYDPRRGCYEIIPGNMGGDVGGMGRRALDPTAPAGQLAAMELLRLCVTPINSAAIDRAMLSIEGIEAIGDVSEEPDGWSCYVYGETDTWQSADSPGAAITAAWLAAAERWKEARDGRTP